MAIKLSHIPPSLRFLVAFEFHLEIATILVSGYWGGFDESTSSQGSKGQPVIGLKVVPPPITPGSIMEQQMVEPG